MHCRGHHVRRLYCRDRVSKCSCKTLVTVVLSKRDATYLRTCIRLSRLGCCRGSPGRRASRPDSRSASRSLDLAVDKPGRLGGSTNTLKDAMPAVEVQPGDDAVGEQC